MESEPLKDRVALITGASKGLGRAMAAALAGAGARLALVSRDRAALDDVAASLGCGDRVTVFAADVTDERQVADLERGVRERVGRVDILVNNAGVNVRKPITEFALDEWRLVLDTNLTGVFLMCRAFVPHMKGRGYGRILNLTSIMSHIALPERTAYAASKAGLLGLTRALALELAGEGVTVNGISPGPFATEMNRPILDDPARNAEFISRIPVGRWGRVEEIGELAVYLCREESGFITGTDIVIDGGWCAQ